MLILSTDIPQGNCATPEISVADGVNHVRFTPHPHGGLERLWFCFRLTNDGRDLLVPETVLEMTCVETILFPGGARFSPVMRRNDGPWERMGAGGTIRTQDGRRSKFWRVPTPDHTLDVAFCYPYGQPELDALLADCGDFFHYDQVGVSSGGRAMMRLANDYGSVDELKPGVYLVGRQHAGEVTGSWVLDGALRKFAECERSFHIWCTPFADIDGVTMGDYGKNAFPHDLNRAWGPNHAMRHETFVLMVDFKRWQLRTERRRSAVFDFHSPGPDEENVYCFLNDVTDTEFTAFMPKLEAKLPAYADVPFVKRAPYQTAAAWGQHHNLRQYADREMRRFAVSFEASYFGAYGKELLIADYRRIGELWAESVIEFLR